MFRRFVFCHILGEMCTFLEALQLPEACTYISIRSLLFLKLSLCEEPTGSTLPPLNILPRIGIAVVAEAQFPAGAETFTPPPPVGPASLLPN